MSIYHFFVKRLGSSGVKISKYKNNTILIVNVASQCGFTEQYQSLQRLYDKFSEQSFSILAFPCNDFLNQEPGSDEEILEFCDRTYGVKFDVFEKVKVRGENLSKFLNLWDKEIYDLNVELRKINLKQKKEQLVVRKKEGLVFRLHK